MTEPVKEHRYASNKFREKGTPTYKSKLTVPIKHVKKMFIDIARDRRLNVNEARVVFRAIYEFFEEKYPDECRWAYNYVSRKYTAQVSRELREQRKRNERNIDDVYEGIYEENL